MRSATRAIFAMAFPVIVAGTLSAQGTKPITTAEMHRWNTIRQNILSNDGKWFVYLTGPTDSDAVMVLRGTAQGAKESRIPVGNGGGSMVISGDSKWLGYIVAPSRPATGGRGGRGRGAGRRRGRSGGFRSRGSSASNCSQQVRADESRHRRQKRSSSGIRRFSLQCRGREHYGS